MRKRRWRFGSIVEQRRENVLFCLRKCCAGRLFVLRDLRQSSAVPNCCAKRPSTVSFGDAYGASCSCGSRRFRDACNTPAVYSLNGSGDRGAAIRIECSSFSATLSAGSCRACKAEEEAGLAIYPRGDSCCAGARNPAREFCSLLGYAELYWTAFSAGYRAFSDRFGI